MENLSIRAYAHIGDAVYEVFAREKTVLLTENPKFLHKLTVSIVNAEFQAQLLDELEPFLEKDEKDISKRARNLAVTTSRRVNQKMHRLSTAFEALIGYVYQNKKERLDFFYKKIEDSVDKQLNQISAEFIDYRY